jgi:hypothetical protein
MTIFFSNLFENFDTKRLLSKILPKCDNYMLAGFVTLAVRPEVEIELLRLTKHRGMRFKAWVRSEGRRAVKADDERRALTGRELLRRADRAFDIRRKSLAEYAAVAYIIREYLQFRSGLKPTARELAALFKAGLAATGRPVFQQVDYDLLRRNLRNFELRRSRVCQPLSGEDAAKIIEVSPAPPASELS